MAAAATLARRAATACQLPRGGARLFSSFIKYGAKLPTSTSARHPLVPKRLVHDGSKEEIEALKARLEELEALKARVQRLEQETSIKFLESDGKLFRLEVIATDQAGKIVSMKELQARHGDLLVALLGNAISEARVFTDRFGMIHSFHAKVLLRMGTLSFKIVFSCIGAAATASFGVVQIVNSNNVINCEKRIDKAVAQRTANLEERFVTGLEQTVKQAVQIANAKKFVEDQNRPDGGGPAPAP